MPDNTATPLSVLVMSHDARDFGGVGNYLATMKRRLRPTTNAHRFVSGRRYGEKTKLATISRIISDYVRFFILMMRRRFDVVHFNPEMDLRAFPRESLFMFLLILMRRPFVVFHHGWNWDEFKIISNSTILKRWLFFILNRAGGIIVCSKSFREGLIENGVNADRIEIITTMFDGKRLKRRDLDTLPDPTRAPKLLFMARFVREKGVYELIESVTLLRDEFPNLTLLMGGDGHEMEKMKAWAEKLGVTDQVLFPGYIRGHDKTRAFAEASIFILPSFFWEGLPNAAIEAMGSGLPIISTKVAGLPEVMDDPDNGFFLDEVTPQDIAEKVRTMLRDPDYLAATSKRNQEKAWGNYESAIVSKQIEAVYRLAIDRNRPSSSVQEPELSEAR
ncbi:MAG: glycosyltransferase family 4 protein [Geminicoccaceae bacterium]